MHAHSLCLPSPVIIPVSHWIGYQTALFLSHQFLSCLSYVYIPIYSKFTGREQTKIIFNNMSKVELREKSLKNGLSSKAKVCNASINGNSSNASTRTVNRNTVQSDGQDEEHSLHPPNAGQSNESGLDIHTDTSGERPFKCSYCEKLYKDLGYLKVHERIHTGEKPCKCGECGKCFAQSSNLVTHKKIHTSDRPHKCDQCDKSFKRSNELKHHKMRLHSEGERPYKCSHCDIAFIISSELKTHMRIHSGEKPFKCTHCPKSFRTAEYRRAHERVHRAEKPYKCPHCTKTFKTIFEVIYQTRATVFHQDIQTPRRELKIRRAAEYF